MAHFEAKGYRVVTPAYPGFEIEVEALRENPDTTANWTVPETVDPPRLGGRVPGRRRRSSSGHSFGGTLTQLLLARGWLGGRCC